MNVLDRYCAHAAHEHIQGPQNIKDGSVQDQWVSLFILVMVAGTKLLPKRAETQFQTSVSVTGQQQCKLWFKGVVSIVDWLSECKSVLNELHTIL